MCVCVCVCVCLGASGAFRVGVGSLKMFLQVETNNVWMMWLTRPIIHTGRQARKWMIWAAGQRSIGQTLRITHFLYHQNLRRRYGCAAGPHSFVPRAACKGATIFGREARNIITYPVVIYPGDLGTLEFYG